MTSGGRFITLEGGEGAGKSTLARALGERLEAAGQNIVLTREPGGSPGGDEIRNLFVRGGETRWSPETEALLVTAARTDHLARIIRPALAAGRWVICDRFTDSTRAYQGAGRGLSLAKIKVLEDWIAAPKPDLTLILDLDPAAGVARSRGARAGEDRFERMDAEFHARVRTAFLEIAQSEPKRCVVIDATQEKDAVLQASLNAVSERLGVRA